MSEIENAISILYGVDYNNIKDLEICNKIVEMEKYKPIFSINDEVETFRVLYCRAGNISSEEKFDLCINYLDKYINEIIRINNTGYLFFCNVISCLVVSNFIFNWFNLCKYDINPVLLYKIFRYIGDKNLFVINYKKEYLSDENLSILSRIVNKKYKLYVKGCDYKLKNFVFFVINLSKNVNNDIIDLIISYFNKMSNSKLFIFLTMLLPSINDLNKDVLKYLFDNCSNYKSFINKYSSIFMKYVIYDNIYDRDNILLDLNSRISFCIFYKNIVSSIVNNLNKDINKVFRFVTVENINRLFECIKKKEVPLSKEFIDNIIDRNEILDRNMLNNLIDCI